MKLSYKIILVNIALAFVITLLLMLFNGGISSGSDFAIGFGIACLIGAVLNLFAGLLFIFSDYRDWGKGFFLSAAALLLLSGISCGSGLSLH